MTINNVCYVGCTGMVEAGHKQTLSYTNNDPVPYIQVKNCKKGDIKDLIGATGYDWSNIVLTEPCNNFKLTSTHVKDVITAAGLPTQ